MVHFPADYSHELYGSLHKNIVDVILFNSPENILNPELKENDRFSPGEHNNSFHPQEIYSNFQQT